MSENIKNLNPLLLAFLAGVVTWLTTALGASVIFFRKEISRKAFDMALGFAGGIMVSASFFSLLLPAIEASEQRLLPAWFIVSAGFSIGCVFIFLLDKIIPHLHPNMPAKDKEGVKTDLSFKYLLVLAITLHNIPEGLALGVAFGSLGNAAAVMTFASAGSLMLALALHNIPEGMAVSIPLRGAGLSKKKSFWFGQLSGAVLPLAAFVGAVSVSGFETLMPYALAFAAGAMMYVVVEEVIPETQRAGNTDLAAMSFLTGIVVMMILDIAL